MCAIKFLVAIGGMIIGLPLYRIAEDMLCHRYFGDDSPGSIDEDRCKDVDEVQAEMAYLFGALGFLGGVFCEYWSSSPGLLQCEAISPCFDALGIEIC